MTMSLVAYGSSGESDSSDNEDGISSTSRNTERVPTDQSQHQSPNNNKSAKSGGGAPYVSDNTVSSSVPIKTNISFGIGNKASAPFIPPPKITTDGIATAEEDADSTLNNHSILSGLPAPKRGGVMSDAVGVAELEDSTMPRVGLPLPPKPAKKRDTVRIVIPSLPDQVDSDEEEPQKKRRAASGKGGLFSLLPPPKNAVTKEAKRPLLPHTLSKAKPSSTAARQPRVPPARHIQATRPGPQLAGVPDAVSDEEADTDTPVSFFSLDSSSNTSHLPTASSSHVRLSVAPEVTSTSVRLPSGQQVGPQLPGRSDAVAAGSMADAPLAFKSSAPGYSFTQKHTKLSHRSLNDPSLQQETDHHQAELRETMAYNQQYTGEFQESVVPSAGDMQQYTQDEQFLRMQGKKFRGKEAINIIDINADDQTVDVDLSKGLSEEKDTRSHSRKKDGLPSSQQRRKHQITYLAFQAKERELELKNQWAENRLTKRQTQSKYGF